MIDGTATVVAPSLGGRGALRTARLAFGLVSSAARRELWATLVLSVFGALMTAAELLVGRHLVELLVDGSDQTSASDLVPWLVALGLVLVAAALVNTAVAELRILLQELVHRHAVDQLLEAATAAELESFDDPQFHDRVERARQNADQYAWQVVWGLVTLMTTSLGAFAVVATLLAVAPLLVPVAAVAYVPIAVVNVRNTRALYRLHYELAEIDRDRAYHERLLTGRVEAKEVRAFGLTGWLRRRHDDLFAVRVDNTRRVVARRTVLALVGSSITSLILVGALAVVMLLALDGRLQVADAAVGIVGLQQLASRLRSSGDATTSMFEGVMFLQNFELLRAEVLVAEPPTHTLLPPPARPGVIAVEHLGYKYPAGQGDALEDVCLELRPGQVLAIVGPNGAGKSTLAKLLCGLLPPTTGCIRWDDIDLAGCDPAAVRKRVSPVFQDFTRFEHTALETIGFGDLERIADREAIQCAASRAGADGFLSALDAGYETRLSTSFAKGTDLSVGQWQRVAVARAFFRDAPLVVMDEPASSLDPRAERDLFAHLHDLGRDRMVVFISHRFATVRRADNILVLLEGQVIEEGNHDQLMDLGAVYAELYTLQAAGFGL